MGFRRKAGKLVFELNIYRNLLLSIILHHYPLIMNNYHNKTRLIGKIGFLEVDILKAGRKKVRFQLCTLTTFLDHTGNPKKELIWHQCIAWDKNADIIEKHTTTGDIVAIDGVLVSLSNGTNINDFPQAFVQVDELLLLDKS